MDTGKLAPGEIAVDELRSVALHGDPALDALVKKHWGSVTAGTPEEQLAEMRRLNNDLNAGQGDSTRGRLLFQKTCAVCHQLFGEGGRIGPDLTHANRADREFLLASIVDPSAVIRKENLAYEITTTDDRVLSGVILDQVSGLVTLGLITGERLSVPQSKIASSRESRLSLMPAGLLKGLSPPEVRDIFAYLQSPKTE